MIPQFDSFVSSNHISLNNDLNENQIFQTCQMHLNAFVREFGGLLIIHSDRYVENMCSKDYTIKIPFDYVSDDHLECSIRIALFQKRNSTIVEITRSGGCGIVSISIFKFLRYHMQVKNEHEFSDSQYVSLIRPPVPIIYA
jgi:hypothetical protein